MRVGHTLIAVPTLVVLAVFATGRTWNRQGQTGVHV